MGWVAPVRLSSVLRPLEDKKSMSESGMEFKLCVMEKTKKFLQEFFWNLCNEKAVGENCRCRNSNQNFFLSATSSAAFELNIFGHFNVEFFR